METETKKKTNQSLLSAFQHPSIIHPSVHQLPAYNFRIMISFLAALRTFLPSFLRNFLQKNTLSLCLSLARHNSQNSFLQNQNKTRQRKREKKEKYRKISAKKINSMSVVCIKVRRTIFLFLPQHNYIELYIYCIYTYMCVCVCIRTDREQMCVNVCQCVCYINDELKSLRLEADIWPLTMISVSMFVCVRAHTQKAQEKGLPIAWFKHQSISANIDLHRLSFVIMISFSSGL